MLAGADEALLANIKIECQRWPANSLISGRSGTQCVGMVTKLVCPQVVKSCCKESSISDTNWLKYLFSSKLIEIRLSLFCHHLANLHILKTGLSLEQKEIVENSIQLSSSCTDYLFMF